MATYRYQAFDKNENKVKGFITADSKSDAINQLQLKELNPSSIDEACLLYTSPSPRDLSTSRMPSSA